MKDILQHINSVDGVMGSAIFSSRGEVLAHACSVLVDEATLKKAASLILECTHGLQISQTLDLLDFRYTDGHLLVKTFPGALLFLSCANGINLQVLSITLNLAVKKLEAKIPAEVTTAKESPAVVNSDPDDGTLRMNISNLTDKKASASFDSLGMVALCQPSYQRISDFYNSPFKKLILTNSAAGTSGTFPVIVMKDMEPHYEGTVIIGPGIEKKLKVSEGDRVEVKIG